MKLIKILAEEFPMFGQYDDQEGLENDDMQTGSDLSSTNFDSMEEKPEGQDECECTCDCPCCSAKRDDKDEEESLPDDGQNLDFSAHETGANLEDPNGNAENADDEFSFKF